MGNMKIIVSAPGEGKTTLMMKWLLEKPEHLLVVFSVQEKQRLFKEFAKEQLEANAGLPEWTERVYTPFELEQFRSRFSGKEVIGVDNADMVLAHFLRRPISIVSMTGNAEVLRQKETLEETT